MRNHRSHWKPIEQNLFGQFAAKTSINEKKSSSRTVSRYLAVHLRFEIDMAAYSMCYFGGGKDEEEELEAYRAIHFPALTLLRNTTKYAFCWLYLVIALCILKKLLLTLLSYF